MKLLLASIMLMILLLNTGCSSKCDRIEKRELILLFDLTDPALFNDIKLDINENFGDFMNRTGLAEINACEEFRLGIAPITSSDYLNIQFSSISVPRRNLSRNAEQHLANPKPLVDFLNHKIEEFSSMSNDPKITAMSVIANVFIKALINSDHEAESTIIFFSDLVENSGQVNFYRRIPASSEIPVIISRMVEPSELRKLEAIQRQGLTANVVVVHKPEPSGKPETRAVKQFWIDLFDHLKIPVQFIDNLTNKIEL